MLLFQENSRHLMWNQPIFLKHKEVDIEQTVYRYILPPNKTISFAYIQQFPSESVYKHLFFIKHKVSFPHFFHDFQYNLCKPLLGGHIECVYKLNQLDIQMYRNIGSARTPLHLSTFFSLLPQCKKSNNFFPLHRKDFFATCN